MSAPVILPPARTVEIGAMPNDDTTPPCRLCGADHVGVLTPTYLTLRGNYMWNAELGCEVFVLDQRIGLEFMALPTGGKAIIVDVNPKKALAAVAHEDCIDEAARKLEATMDFDEDEMFRMDHEYHLDRF